MKFKNKTNSCSLWIEEAKTMIIWGDSQEADVTDKKAINYLKMHGYVCLDATPTSTTTTKKA